MRNAMEKRKSKFLLIPILGLLLLLSLLTVFGFAAKTESVNDGLRKGLTTEAPKNFAPQMVQNKYKGGNAYLDENQNIVVSCPQYSSLGISIPNEQWYKDNIKNCYYMSLCEESDLLSISINAIGEKTFIVSFYDNMNELITIEAKPSSALENYIVSSCIVDNEQVAQLKTNNIENDIIFLDAQINQVVSSGEAVTLYNVADDGWTEYTDAQVEELKGYFDNRELKLKLSVELLDTTTGHWLKEIENITNYIPKWIFLRDGKSAFIGQEYGFIADIREYYDDRWNSNYYDINSIIIFSLDRQFTGREYSYKIEVLINTDGAAYVYHDGYSGKDNYTEADYLVKLSDDEFSYGNMLLADPTMSASIANLYEINEFDAGYDPNKDASISISQVRMNYDGYYGKKEKKKLKSASEITTSIYSIGDKAWNIADTVTDLATTANILEHIAKGANIFGKAAGVILKVNPYIAIASAVIEIGEEIYKIVDDNKTEFKSAKANNEANILTFPAPSQEVTKSAISRFGLNSRDIDKSKAVMALSFEDKDEAEFVLGKAGHYAQSIFMLNEVTKPTAFTSYLNMAFALDNSGSFDSKVPKFHIPEKFNFSERTTRLFDTGNIERVYQGEEKKISFFGSDSSKIQLAVSETGYYDLKLSDFNKTAQITIDNKDKIGDKEFDMAKNPFEREGNTYVPLRYSFFDKDKSETDDKIYNIDDVLSLKKVRGDGSFSYIDTDNDGIRDTIRMFLSEGQDSVFYINLASGLDKENSVKWRGATFKANLTRHYDEIKANEPLSKTLKSGEKQYYTFYAPHTGIYKLIDENGQFSFDLLAEDFVSMQLNQEKIEAVLSKGQKYYIAIKNNKSFIEIGKVQILYDEQIKRFDYASNLELKGTLADNEKINAYTVDLSRSGTHSFINTNSNITYRIKDSQLKDVMFGGEKVYLKSGKYYIIIRSSNDNYTDANYNVSMKFTPQEIKIEKQYTMNQDTYYMFKARESGSYKFNISNDSYGIEIDNMVSDANNVFKLIKGNTYIVHVKDLMSSASNVNIAVQYYPNVFKTFNENFNDKVAELTTGISGYYHFLGNDIAIYDEELVQINQGTNFTNILYSGKKYFIINSGTNSCEVVLDGIKITVNFELTINAGDNQYLKFVAPETGSYDIKSYHNNGKTEFTVFSYNQLSQGIALERSNDGYAFAGGSTYYIKVDASVSDFITVINGDVNMLAEIPEGTLAEVELDDKFNYASSYKFNPIESGYYKFIFNRNLKKDFSILIDGQIFSFSEGQNIYEVCIYLTVGNSYEISFNLLSFGNATLVFGVYKQINSFDTFVSDRLQNDTGLVNKLAVGENKNGYISEQVSVANIDGRTAYTKITYEILNTPYINGIAGVTIDPSGRLTVSNKLPQWTAFAVKINIGKYVYGDVVLDEGISKVVNFLIYVDVQDIKIFDDTDVPVYNIDIAHKDSMELTAKVFPSHAAQADKLQYHISDVDKQYVSLVVTGNKATITALYTTPNKKYVKIQASCGNEFTVIIMVRVYANQIYVSSAEDIKKLDSGTATAYELIVNGSSLGNELRVPQRIKYLKIRAGSTDTINNFSITVQSNDLTLVLDSIKINGTQDGLIRATEYNLNLHFINYVDLNGWNGNSSRFGGVGAITARNLVITKDGINKVNVFGGNGYSQGTSDVEISGGLGGTAIVTTSYVTMNNTQNLMIQGGNGGDGSKGKAGNSVTIENTIRDKVAEDGENGSAGGRGGNGGAGISCANFQANYCEDITVKGGAGGSGGKGGDGSQGGNGGKGHDSDGKDAANGKVGGFGGSGASGGNGGTGAKAILGNVIVANSKIVLRAGNGGNAGAGGHGANGGRGGDGGDDRHVFGKEGIGGQGGDGGNGGQSGSIGSKGATVANSNIINNGSSSVLQTAALDGSTALQGYKGYGGEGGNQGDQGGFDANVPAKAPYGSDGTGRSRY